MIRKARSTIWITFIVIGISLFLVSRANAAYTRVLPNGLSSSPKAAASQVQGLVSNDTAIQAVLAKDNGLSAKEIATARVSSASPTKVTIGKTEDNTARNATTGAIVPTSYMYGKTVAAWKITLTINASKTIVVKWKKDCSNPFLKKGPVRPPLRITKFSKTFVLPFRKSKTVTRTIICPSGQSVTIPITVKVSGRARVTSITMGVKVISQKFKAGLRAKVEVIVRARCGKMPKPQSEQPKPQPEQPVSEKCTAGQKKVWDSQQNAMVCVSIDQNNNCGPNTVINGNGNTVNNYIDCSVKTPPPPEECKKSCQPPPPPPPPETPPKDGTKGPGTGTPGQPGGPGSGGEPGPREGTGESCRLSDGSIGYKDQFGYCNPYPAT